jgi:predicted lysophospholipase L1 biosynthesis ABC-type transport system permease subunit
VKAILADALTGLRARRGRAALAGGGVFAASLVLGVVATAAYALATGFDRSADRADLPSVIARFADEDSDTVDERVRRLPNLAARSYRTEITGVGLRARGRSMPEGVVHIVGGGRRGYAIVKGRDVAGRGDEAVIEAGLAREWGLGPGDRIDVGRLGPVRVAGVALSPDNVAFPLVRTARVYLSRRGLVRRFGGGDPPVNVALLWARDESRTDVLLSQARASAIGLSSLRFTTRAGVRALVEQGAGLVVALLVAFALVAASLAGVLLAAGGHSDVQRRLPVIGVRRALGASRSAVVTLHAAEGALIAAPAGGVGIVLGGLLATGPVSGVLEALNELAPGTRAQALLLLVLWAAVVGLVTVTSAWPAWRATRDSPALLMRRGDVRTPRGRAGATGGLGLLGAHLVTAHRARYFALVAILGAAAAVILLLLALASLLTTLRDDPATLGKRYQVTAELEARRAAAVEAISGVSDAAPRYEIDAVSATALGSPLQLIAYPGDHTRFEAPALAEGRRVRAPGEAEVGVGLADAVGLRVGSTLAVQPRAARELRFRVVGIVRALQDEGRVAYVRPERLAAALPFLDGPLAIRLEPGADREAVRRDLAELGAEPRSVSGATGDDRGLLDVLAALLRLVAVTVALVCLTSLVQALALTAAERRGAVATLRAAGGDARALRRLLAGAALAVVVPAALVALALEGLVLAPATERLAAGYADLPLRTGPGQVALVAAGLVVLTASASAWTARRLVREPVVAGLREVET